MAAQKKFTSRKEQRLQTVKPADRSAESTAKFLAKWPTRCLDHEEVVSQYCLEHDQLLCDVCAMSAHNRCNDVMSLDDASKGMILLC